MSRRDSWRRQVEAYHDGELSAWGRWRVRRRLARDPQARRALAELSEWRALLRQHGAEQAQAGADLWPGIRGRLPQLGPPARSRRLRSSAAPAWAGAGLVAAGLALWLALSGGAGDASAARSLRWLRTEGQTPVVVQDDGEATIIWLLGAPAPLSGSVDVPLG